MKLAAVDLHAHLGIAYMQVERSDTVRNLVEMALSQVPQFHLMFINIKYPETIYLIPGRNRAKQAPSGDLNRSPDQQE